MGGNDARDRDILVNLVPPESVTVDFDCHFRELLFGCGLERFEAVSWEANDSTVGEFDVDHALLGPRTDGGGLNGAIGSRKNTTHVDERYVC
jgi:hypothetical protein